VDEDDATPTAALRGHLGAESIDFPDTVFRLEREFRIENPHGELFPGTMCDDHTDLARGTAMTGEGMLKVRPLLPHAGPGGIAGYRRLEAVAELFTVGQLARYVAWKTARAERAVPAIPATAAVHDS
jgi:hypothetical protein